MPNFGTSAGAFVGNGGVMQMPRADGISDVSDVIQGVRAYDSSIGTWTTPDAYSGTVSDPMSQKSYMWNNNNPLSYTDPSGFLSDSQQVALNGFADTFGLGVEQPSSIACTDFILDAYKGVLRLDIRAELMGDMLHLIPVSLLGYNVHGITNGNFAGNADNLHHFFESTGQLHSYTAGMKMEVGDIIFLADKGKPKSGNTHVAMVSDVDALGNPTAVIEGTGHSIVRKSWDSFSKAVNDQNRDIDSVGRDDHDSAPMVIYHSSAMFYDAQQVPL